VTRVINLLGAPGAGKSTAAAGLFYRMKKEFKSVELVTEYAKDLIYSGAEHRLVDQAFLFAEQHHRVSRLVGKVDYVITDSPLVLSAFYMPKDYPKEFEAFVMAMNARYDNVNLYLERDHPYKEEGRIHSEVQSRAIDKDLKGFLDWHGIAFQTLTTGDDVCDRLYEAVFSDCQVERKPNAGCRPA